MLFFLYYSLGIVLSRGYGEYIFTGNVSVEEGKFFFFFLWVLSSCTLPCSHFAHFLLFSPGLHDLLTPDLIIANEW